MNPVEALSEKILIVGDEASLEALLTSIKIKAQGKPVRIGFVNAHAVNLAHENESFLNDLMACDYVFRDGSGMKILYKWLNKDAGLNLNGTDLIPRILDLYKGETAALMGTREPFLGRAAEKIAARGVKVARAVDGFQPDAAYAAHDRAAITILAMGMPKQERVAALMAANGNAGLIVCGGAVLDFMGGKVRRAPALFRKTGMEWVYRLCAEPRRMFGRYVIGNFVFLYRAKKYASARGGKS